MAGILIGSPGSLFCACLVLFMQLPFLIAAQQLVPLVGEHGLTPANHFFQRVEAHFGSRSAAALQLPSLFWFGISDQGLSIFAWVGFGLSLVVLGGYANAILLAILWAMYMSIIHVGQIWYGYGWETQLLETGFLSIFLCPLLDGRPFPRCRPPLLVIWLFRWLGFRIMIGAGLIKLRGDPCWRDLTCLYYHYETQPIPSPLSRYLHFAPHWFHKFGTAWNHFIELIVPWFSFGPRRARHVAGILLVSFQIILIISGNLSFLNYVTIIPFLACFDDTFLRRILPRPIVKRAERAAQESEPSRINNTIAIGLSLLVAYLSIAPVANLISERQMMNTSFDRLSLVNTYGAFGAVGKERDEIIFEGTDDAIITGDTKWKEYEFKAKPGNPDLRPPFIAPVSTAHRLANLVRRHGFTGGISMDAAFRLETTAQRSWHAFPSRRSIHFQLDRRTTFARNSIAIISRRRVTQPGGNANQSVNGYPPCRSTTNNSAAFSPRWIGWIRAF